MTALNITLPIYNDDVAARAYLEAQRWPNGASCPHCGEAEKVYRLEGEGVRPGLFHCKGCRKQFSVTVGSVMERSHIPLCKWVLAMHLMASSKKGMSAHQMHRMMGITYKSAWFLCHRIRLAMTDEAPTPMGGEGQTVEADETYLGSTGVTVGKDGTPQKKRGHGNMKKVVALVERGGRSRAIHVQNVTSGEVRKILKENVKHDTGLVTDEANHYRYVGKEFASHGTVNHSKKEYAKAGGINTNTIEGYFSIFKRGMKGVYQHCGEQHLQRYLNEFDFRYSNRALSDFERADVAVKGAAGKRITYRRTDQYPPNLV